MSKLLIAYGLTVFVHIFSFAVFALVFRVKVREISVGFGPVLFRIGKLTTRIFILGGYVKMADSRVEKIEDYEISSTFNHQPLFVRICIISSGFIMCLLIASLINFDLAQTLFVQAFYQVINGALNPLTAGVQYLENITSFCSVNSFSSIFAATLSIYSAINLLPLPALNGGQLILECFELSETLLHKVLSFGVLTIVCLCLSWLVSVTNYVWF